MFYKYGFYFTQEKSDSEDEKEDIEAERQGTSFLLNLLLDF